MSTDAALQKFLSRVLSRSALSSEEQRAILSLNCRASQFPARIDIVSPDERVDYACLVGSGVVGRFDQMRNGQRQTTAFYIAGDMCDLHSVVAPTAAWGLAALSAATILHVPHSELRELVLTYPRVALAFWRDATADA